jgi:DNA-binding MarR family transcriptional regulator
MSDDITDDLRDFIVRVLPSVPHLEALLLLRRDSQRVQTASDIAARLYIDRRAATNVLADLVAAELIACRHNRREATYHFAPKSAIQAARVDELEALYSHSLVAVTRLIHERSAQLFADAFRFRKE